MKEAHEAADWILLEPKSTVPFWPIFNEERKEKVKEKDKDDSPEANRLICRIAGNPRSVRSVLLQRPPDQFIRHSQQVRRDLCRNSSQVCLKLETRMEKSNMQLIVLFNNRLINPLID